jgi:MoxR-like ATPase
MADSDDVNDDVPLEAALSNEKLFYAAGMEQLRRPVTELPRPARLASDAQGSYRPTPALVRAANVALMLRMPLLLTGEPGVGKSEFARALARDLFGVEARPLIEHPVTSNADKGSLLYRYDELARLRSAYEARGRVEGTVPEAPSDTTYISFVGLGLAILRAGGTGAALEPIEALGAGATQRGLKTFGQLVRHGTLAPDGETPVVLLDEVDKAPRDLPNDILTEIEQMRFDIPELGVRVRLNGQAQHWPIVIITSNSERTLPDAFLRRCVYHHITSPARAALRAIVAQRLADLNLVTDGTVESPLLRDALDIMAQLRDQSDLMKKPATAEFLAWVRLLADRSRMALGSRSLRDMLEPQLLSSLGVLLKTADDVESGTAAVREWRTSTSTA